MNMHFPRLLDLRHDADKTQKGIAALVGIDQRVYSNYETGKREMTLQYPKVLADYYGTTIDYIVGRGK